MTIRSLKKLIIKIENYSQLMSEYGADISSSLLALKQSMQATLQKIHEAPIDLELAQKEPNLLGAIQKLRPNGPRNLSEPLTKSKYQDKLEGALLARLAGCTLGAPVEFWDIHKMEALAKENGDKFPPMDYWSYVPEPATKRYEISPREFYTRDKMDGVPVDDDIMYTLLGLLIVESYGVDFTTANVGQAWLDYLPYACTAEEVALKNLKNGVSADKAGEINNPFCEWIGGYIRADPWGYLAPGWPEKAAEMAFRDTYLSHRRQGIYGAMFFAATISAAFVVSDPIEAIKIGLTEIPRDCSLANAIHWSLNLSSPIENYYQARNAVLTKFEGMSWAHTINNACLTVFGITIGKTDVTRVIGELVAAGLDNDCTAATAGSIIGAIVGKKHIPSHWYKNFNNTIHSYLIHRDSFQISDIVKRFTVHARRLLPEV
jgi:ADP-ribosylglycohydrolase